MDYEKGSESFWAVGGFSFGTCKMRTLFLPPISFRTTREPVQFIVYQKISPWLVKENPEKAEDTIKSALALEIGKQLIEKDAVILSRTEDPKSLDIVFRAELLVLLP